MVSHMHAPRSSLITSTIKSYRGATIEEIESNLERNELPELNKFDFILVLCGFNNLKKPDQSNYEAFRSVFRLVSETNTFFY